MDVDGESQAEWSVQRVNPEVGSMVKINLITRDHVYGSIQRLPDRLLFSSYQWRRVRLS